MRAYQRRERYCTNSYRRISFESRMEDAISLVGLSAKHENFFSRVLRPPDRKKQSLSNLSSTFRAFRTLQHQITNVNKMCDNQRSEQPTLGKGGSLAVEWQ
jgi:hypothetical protein